jgi:O-antigen ligase
LKISISRALAPLPASLLLYLAVAAFISDVFLGDIDIGPVSSRIYILGAAAVILAARLMNGDIPVFESRTARLTAASFALFIAWSIVNDLIRGDALVATVREVGTTTCFGLLLFVVVQASVKRDRDLVILGGALAVSATFNALIASSQWLGVEAAWDLGRVLRPDDIFDSFSAVAGISLFSIPLGNHLLTGLVMMLGAAFWWPQRKLAWDVIFAAGISLMILGLVFSLTRSALGASIVTGGSVLLVHFFRRPGGPQSIRALLPTAVGLALAAVVLFSVQQSDSGRADVLYPNRTERYTLARTTTVASPERWSTWRYAIDAWLESPLIGDTSGYVRGFDERRLSDPTVGPTRSPHNLFLNSLVWHGAIGTAVLVGFLVLIALAARDAVWRSFAHPVRGPVAVTTVAATLAFLMNSQFHNESFITGSSIGFWLVAMLVAVERVRRIVESDA